MSDACTLCNEDVDSDGFECGRCEKWTHYKCGGLSTSAAAVKVLEADRVFIFCDKCLLDVRTFLKNPSVEEKVSAALAKTGERFTAIESKVDALMKSLAPLIPTASNTNSQPETPSYSSVASRRGVSNAKIITVGDFKAIQQEDAHRRNLVVKGLLEKGAEGDLAEVVALIGELDNSVRVVEVFRMGNRPKDGTPRLLKVHLASSSCVRSVLNEARKLKDSVRFKDVYVRRSMTVEERNRMTALHKKKDELNKLLDENSTTKFVVSYEKIMKIVNCERKPDGSLSGGTRDSTFRVDVNQEN